MSEEKDNSKKSIDKSDFERKKEELKKQTDELVSKLEPAEEELEDGNEPEMEDQEEAEGQESDIPKTKFVKKSEQDIEAEEADQEAEEDNEEETAHEEPELIDEKPKKKTGLFKKIVLFTFLFFFICGLAGVGGVSLWMYKLSKELPATVDLVDYKYKMPTIIYDREGEILAEMGDERRYPVSLEDMSKYMPMAVVSVEDSRFYDHGGVDLMGIMRAFVTNIKAGRLVEGGSTLTQQLVKNIYLTPEKKLRRKVKEAILAYRIDKNLGKDKILEIYLNQVYFGRGAYGVEAAAKNYFGKTAKELSMSESAMIAGLAKSPGRYAPHINPERALSRRNHVLYRMFETGYITEDEYKKASAEGLSIVESIPPKNVLAGYFIEYIKQYLEEVLEYKDPMNEGLKVHTTLDLRLQLAAEKSLLEKVTEVNKDVGFMGPVKRLGKDESAPAGEVLKEMLEIKEEYIKELGYDAALITDIDKNTAKILLLYGKKGVVRRIDNRWAKAYGSKTGYLLDMRDILEKNDIIYVKPITQIKGRYLLEQTPGLEGSLMTIKPDTGEILAMQGGLNFARSKFNRTVQAKRQVGSLFKPIVYAAALENGFKVNTEIFDAPVIRQSEKESEFWRPSNDSGKFYGLTTLKEALTKSRNVVTIKIAERVGIDKVLEYAKKFGVTSKLNRDLSISLGSNGISLDEMVSAFSVFPNLGTRRTLVAVNKVVDRKGEVIFEKEEGEMFQVIKPETAQLMTDILMNVVQHGTGVRIKRFPRMVAGKTGTTNDSRDTWFIGFTANIVTGVWVGFDDYSKKMGRYRFGSNTALPVWKDYMEKVIPYFEMKMFPVAENVEYFKVDENNKVTDAYADKFTFEPFDKGGLNNIDNVTDNMTDNKTETEN